MIEQQTSIRKVLDKIYHPLYSFDPKSLLLSRAPFSDRPGVRPNSASVEDGAFGDSGKGSVTQKINALFAQISPTGRIISDRWNGGTNAGHEIEVNGVRIATHQLPVAVAQEGAIAIMGRGMVVHPIDLVTEIEYVSGRLGGRLWGDLLIDENAIVTTDLHRAIEAAVNNFLDVGKGSTSSGIAQAYSSFYEKRANTMRDLMSPDWKEKFTQEYHFATSIMHGLKKQLNLAEVKRLTKDGKRETVKVGSLDEYLDQLDHARAQLQKYVKDVRGILETAWYEGSIPITLEGAQGPGLDPWLGVYSDVTASRPLALIGVQDTTEGVILASQIAMRTSTVKVPYMSSVGSRVPPYQMNPELAEKYAAANEEWGKSTGRAREILPIDLHAMRAYQKGSGATSISVTHLDAAYPEIPIEVVIGYNSKETGRAEPYRPYQWHWDTVEGVTEQLPSWDGKEAAKASTIEDLPINALLFLHFLSEVLAPVALATNGRQLENQILFWNK